MPYEKKISRQCPSLIALVLDESKSMGDMLPGTSDSKFSWVERLAGINLREALERSTEIGPNGVTIKSRYYFSLLKYGTSPELWGEPIMSVEQFVERFANAGNSFGLGGKLGATDTRAAFEAARDILRNAVVHERFRNSFPPTVFHLTDGESQTDARDVADEIKSLSTTDGDVLIVNAYVGTQTSVNYQGPEDFPGYISEADAGPSADNIRLFQMSSEIPESIRQNLINDGIFPKLQSGVRAFFDVRTKDMLKHVMQVVGSIGSRAEPMLR